MTGFVIGLIIGSFLGVIFMCMFKINQDNHM